MKKPKGKREPRAKARAKAKAWTRYGECAAQWNNDPDLGSGNWLLDKPKLSADAVTLLATLRQLDYLTKDQRYIDMHRHLILHSGLIDAKGKWSRWSVLTHPDTQWLCERMEQYIREGVPEREVLAEVAATFSIKAQSFDAAVQRLRALLHAHRKTVSEKPA